MRDHSIDSIYVTDRDRQLLGLLEADAASRAIEAKAETITGHLTQDFRKVPPDEPLQNLFAMFSEKSYPIAVVDEQQRLLGVVVKGAVLDELARAGEQ
jgi:glycine betaine/proline transport system ATP-binding protein